MTNMEYNELLKQVEESNRKLHRTKDINVADCLTWEDRDAIAKIVDKRVAEVWGDMYPFRWQFTCSGHFVC
tara:strand:- start:541 stop:753 length:213 start_codon:yes stop_codon:yes gene_type:complete